MKKTFLAAALLGLFATGAVNAQDQDKKKVNGENVPTEQTTEMTQQEQNAAPEQSQQLSNEQNAEKQELSNYEPNQNTEEAKPVEVKDSSAE